MFEDNIEIKRTSIYIFKLSLGRLNFRDFSQAKESIAENNLFLLKKMDVSGCTSIRQAHPTLLLATDLQPRAQMISSKTRADVRRHRGAAAMLLGARRRDVVIARHNCTAPFVSSITRLD